MAIIEKQTLISSKDADGNTIMHFPVTHVDFVENAASQDDLKNITVDSVEKLTTPRNINGVPFDGTEDITIVNTISQGGTGANTAADARNNLNLRLRTYTALGQLGLADTATPAQIANALPEHSEVHFYARTSVHTGLNLPSGGSLRIEKRSTAGYSTVNFFLYSQTTTPVYYAVYSTYNDVGFSGWVRIPNENNFPALDYDSKVALSMDVNNTMAADGYIYIRLASTSNNPMAYANFTVNGVTVPGIQANSYSTDSIYFPVRKGDVVKGTWGVSTNATLTFNFYKLRGWVR